MSKIHVLDKHVAELIAAGEVVERPSSVVKELMENSIDAGSSSICIEIQSGGVRMIRITDNGVGMVREDVPIAFLRHATSKVRQQEDLDNIGTLGFRGEALASICAVSRVELMTQTKDALAGTRFVIEGGDELLTEDCARPQGTTITVRDLFYNVPARMKFLKKDVSEANSVAGVVDRIALSHPEISVRFIRDGKEELLTPGDGKLLSCIYAVFGRDFAAGMIPLEYIQGGVHVYGYICKPGCGRANRTMQHFYINGRYVKTRTAMAAIEEAYKGSMMVAKYPSCVMYIDLPLETVDVNVHPAKIEVRFINERPVFDAVYHGVKSAIMADNTHEQVQLAPEKKSVVSSPAPQQTRLDWNLLPKANSSAQIETKQDFSQSKMSSSDCTEDSIPLPLDKGLLFRDNNQATYNRPLIVPDIFCDESDQVEKEKNVLKTSECPSEPLKRIEDTQNNLTVDQKSEEAVIFNQHEKVAAKPDVRYLGEAFSTYVFAQMGTSVFIIDKHAAHERLLYDKLTSSEHTDAQMLLSPISVTLSREEYAAILSEMDTLKKAGFEAEDFGDHSILIRAVPMMLDKENITVLIQEIAGGLAAGKHEISTNKLDWIYHSAACRAAIKAGDSSQPEELKALAERVLLNDDIRTCPHGRPVCFELTRHELEKQFGRVK